LRRQIDRLLDLSHRPHRTGLARSPRGVQTLAAAVWLPFRGAAFPFSVNSPRE
jgi:hypothetical protein